MSKESKVEVTGKKPEYRVVTPVEYGDKKVFWQQVGVGFISDKTIQVILNALPVNGKLNLFENTDKDEK